ncbi:MAG: M48 family metallopeptidase [Dokdonella sp.]
MSYENPPLPDGVNVSAHSVLGETVRLAAMLVVILALFGTSIHFGAGWLARAIPFSTELSWVGGERVFGIDVIAVKDSEAAAADSYATELAGKLAAVMLLPAGMALQMHFSDSEVPNAFATLGGHIVITRGLYRLMPSENALALVIAHEIAHIRERDPISAVAGGASLAVIMALVTGDASAIAPYVARIVQLGYSRRAEERADEAGIAALRAHYGHAGGASAAFEALRDARLFELEMPTVVSTHPLDAERIERMRVASAGWNPEEIPLLPLRVSLPR